MPVNILMPALSPTMEHGNLSKWLKQEGDAIKSGDVIAEIETDKATMEVEAVDEGILAKILVPEGTSDVPVNEIIGLIASEGEDVAEAAKGPSDNKFSQPATRPADEQSAQRTAEQVGKQSGQPAASAPAGGKPDEAKAEAAASEKGYGVTPGQTPPAPNAAQTGEGGGRIFASPLAKRLAKEGGLELAGLQGSGPHGRIVERDVKAALEGGAKPQAKAAAAPQPEAALQRAPAPAGASDEAVKKLFPAGSFEEVPHDSMRKVIARRLVEAKTTVPHFYLTVDCEIDALLALREQVNSAAPKDKDGKPAYKVSVNDMVIKAYALGLRAVPDANVSWTEATMLHHKAVDVGVAVSIPGGLITPIIRNADSKTISAISNEMKDLAGRARGRKLKPEEYQGGTGAVSNLGMYGIKNFSAVINPPHSTILAVGAGQPTPVVRGGEVKTATLMSLTLSTDHRAVDGALGAELISAVKRYIEHPMSMLV